MKGLKVTLKGKFRKTTEDEKAHFLVVQMKWFSTLLAMGLVK